jgi:hypothetical protein
VAGPAATLRRYPQGWSGDPPVDGMPYGLLPTVQLRSASRVSLQVDHMRRLSATSIAARRKRADCRLFSRMQAGQAPHPRAQPAGSPERRRRPFAPDVLTGVPPQVPRCRRDVLGGILPGCPDRDPGAFPGLQRVAGQPTTRCLIRAHPTDVPVIGWILGALPLRCCPSRRSGLVEDKTEVGRSSGCNRIR